MLSPPAPGLDSRIRIRGPGDLGRPEEHEIAFAVLEDRVLTPRRHRRLGELDAPALALTGRTEGQSDVDELAVEDAAGTAASDGISAVPLRGSYTLPAGRT